MKKKLLVFAFCISLLIFLYQPLLTLGVRLALYVVLPQAAYEEITWQKNTFTIKNLTSEDPSLSLKVDQVTCALSLSEVQLQITHPELFLKTWEKTEKKHRWLIALFKARVEHGVFCVAGSPRLYFSLRPQEEGVHHLSIAYHPEAPAFCEMKAQVLKEQIAVEMQVKEVSLAGIAPFIAFYSHESLALVKETEGMIAFEGQGAFNKEGKLLALDATVHLKHLQLSKPYHMSFEEVQGMCSYLPSHQGNAFLKDALLALDVRGGKLETEQGYALQEIEGMITKKAGEEAFFDAQGELFGKALGTVVVQGRAASLDAIQVTSLKGEKMVIEDLFCADFVSLKEVNIEKFHVLSGLGEIQMAAFQHQGLSGKDLSGTFSWKDEELNSLELTGELCGLRGKVTTAALEETSFLNFHFEGIFQEAPLLGPCIVSGSLFKEAQEYDLLGKIAVHRESFDFGFSFQRMTFVEGWIEKKGLCLQHLNAYFPQAEIQGTVDLLLTVDQQGCQLALTSSEPVTLKKEESVLTLPHLSLDRGAPCLIFYEWKEQKIKGSFPLKDATLVTQGITLHELFGDLEFEKGMIRLAHYTASCFHIPIEGDAFFSYQNMSQDFLSHLRVSLPKTYPMSDLTVSMGYQEKEGLTCEVKVFQDKIPLASMAAVGKGQEVVWDWTVDPSSQLLGICLNVENLKTKGFAVESLFLRPVVSCKFIPYCLDFISACQFPIDSQLLSDIKNLQLEGSLTLDLSFTPLKKWRFLGKTAELSVKGNPVGSFLCKGSMDGHTVVIEQLEWGDIKAKGVCAKQEDRFVFSTVRGSYGKASFELEGNFKSKEALFVGEGTWTYPHEVGVTLKSKEKTAFSYHAQEGLCAEGVTCDLYDTKTWAHLGIVRAAKANSALPSFHLEGLQFSVSPTVFTRWEEALPPALKRIGIDGYFEGEGDLEYQKNQLSFKGSLKEGTYRFGEHAFFLEKIALTYDQAILGVRLKAQIQEGAALWMEAHVNTGQFPYGMIRMSPSLQATGLKALFKTDQKRTYVESIKGECAGCDVVLEKSKASTLVDSQVLSGTISVNFKELKPFMAPLLQKKIDALKLGSGYAFQGDVIVPDGKPLKILGNLMGLKTELLGFSFEKMAGKLCIDEHHVQLSDFKLLDPAGTIEMRKMIVDQKGEGFFAIPLLQIRDLKPSILSSVDALVSKEHPFTITNCSFEGIRGKLSDVTTWEGEGMLHFTNTVKKENTFWDAPLDLIKRLGLDPGLLTPICGDLHLKLAGDKIYLDHLKNAFSEKERSQFFLSIDQPSYVDLDGNIRIDMRMKQEVLLKVTEKLLLMIRGTLEKPKYGLGY